MHPSGKQSAETIGRRDFLKTGVAAAVGSAAIGGGASAAGEPPANPPKIPTRPFGKIGRELPLLGYGGAALPKTWLNPLSHEERVQLVRYAYDRGLRYFDTSPIYMESEAILGEALKDRRRQVCLVTKVETTRPDGVRKSVEQSLKTLQTDYLDLILIHGTPGLEQMTVEQAMKIHAELVKLRDEKVTRFVGFSAHSYFDKALALISSGGFDHCMLAYGYLPRGYNQVHSARMIELRNACVAKAHELGMGIAAMKVIGAGMLGAWSEYMVPGFDKQRLRRLPAAAIRWVLQDERIGMLTIGMRLKEEIDANIKALSGPTAYTLEDRALLAGFSARLYDTDHVKKLRID